MVPFLGCEDPLENEWQPTPDSCLENPMDRGTWRAVGHRGHKRVKPDLVTKEKQLAGKVISF